MKIHQKSGRNDQPEIDFVVTWVDGSDKDWQREKAAWNPEKANDAQPERYRDWDLMRFWFRGVEQFAPWVRKIHFVTWGHLPSWLYKDNPKLHIVNHKDFIPEEYLPLFNSNAIEIHMHRIKGLAENFVYFNDDIFLTGPAKPTDFFAGGRPCDLLAFQPVVANPQNEVMSHLYLNNTLTLSRHFRKRENVWRQPGSYFHIGYPPLYFFYNFLELLFPLYTGFYTVHGTFPFCKRIFEEVWEKERDALEATSRHRFRSSEDVTIYLFREWQMLNGDFVPRNIMRRFRYYNLRDENRSLLRDIRNQRRSVVCINDTPDSIDYSRVKRELWDAFNSILPRKSSFEIE